MPGNWVTCNWINGTGWHVPVGAILKKQKRMPMIVELWMYNMELSPHWLPETSMFHKHITQKLANETGEKYEKVQTLIRCKLSFLILKSVLLSIRGSCYISKETDLSWMTFLWYVLQHACFDMGMRTSLFCVSCFGSQVPVFILSISHLCTDLVGFSLMLLLLFFYLPCFSNFAIC